MGLNVTDVGFDTDMEERELKKHAASIHCSNTLSLLQRKISNALLYHAYKELLLKEEHEISIKQLCKLISYQGHNHTAIKDALKELLSTVIEWNVVSDSTGLEDWTASSILASVSLQGPICLYAYSPRMKQLLHSPSMFGKINLVIQSRFKSSYGLALYENCIRYRGLPYTKWLELSVFRKLMGVPETKYPIFRDFKKRVLDKSIEEVNMYSDLTVEAELYREGRQVTRIRFSLKERERKVRLGGGGGLKLEEPSNDEGADEEMLKMRLMNQFGLSPDQIQIMFNEYSKDYIVEKLFLVESSRNFQQGKIQNLVGYLQSALKNNYQLPKQGLSKAKSSDKEEFVQLQRRVEQIREAYVKYRENEIDQALQTLTKEDLAQLMHAFWDYAKQPIATVLRVQKSKYNRDNVTESPQIKALLRQFALDRLAWLKKSLESLENFVAKLPEEKASLWKKFQALVPDSQLLKFAETEFV